jgi:hypothetical protein
LQFISTPSEKHVRALIDRLGKSRGRGKKITVTWRVDRENEPMIRTAQRIKKASATWIGSVSSKKNRRCKQALSLSALR